ncbi:cytochrome P450 [Nocardia sp. NPDC052566]|uniref:cytochrome P450 n=1 Tax=Nocardia sp. NPDC052566 TaxID=3364330 RepID=UPI0037CB0DA5
MAAAATIRGSSIPLVTRRFDNTRRLVRAPLPFISELALRHGDVVGVRLLSGTQVVVTNPLYMKHIMQDHLGNFTRETDAHKAVRPFMGSGMATIADHTRWRRNRRLAQPAFHHRRIAEFGELMVNTIEVFGDEWARKANDGNVIDLAAQMSTLTLRIVAQALFGLDPDDPALVRFAAATECANVELTAFSRLPFPPLRMPTPGHRRFWCAIADMDSVVYDIITQFRGKRSDTGLLAMFMNAVDADTGERLSDKELRDEVVTMLFAGHETSAATLTWAWLLLDHHPDILAKVRDEAAVLRGHAEMADLPRLGYTRQVIEETLRLYPPGWNLGRRAATDDEFGGYRIPAGTQLLQSIYHAHRHPDFWDRPEVFDPDRFSPAAVAARDRYAYLPFSVGGHRCIGNAFAMTEMQLALASLVCRFDLNIPNPDLTPTAQLTLTSRRPVAATLTKRM